MRLFTKVKDGGPESPVDAFVLIEIKWLFSIMLLRFAGTRDAYHSHAFDALTWWLKGTIVEKRIRYFLKGDAIVDEKKFSPSIVPKYTPRDNLHKVVPEGTAWAFTIRGPWKKTWVEWTTGKGFTVLTHGREVVR